MNLQESGKFVEVCLTCEELVGVTWRVSDFEELSGGYLQGMMEVGFSGLFFYHFPTTTQVNILKIVPVMIV